MELKDMTPKNMTPYEKLKSLGYTTPQQFCLFPTLILDRLVDLQEVVNYPKSVREHLGYDRTEVVKYIGYRIIYLQKSFPYVADEIIITEIQHLYF
jgi:hypothetical protein